MNAARRTRGTMISPCMVRQARFGRRHIGFRQRVHAGTTTKRRSADGGRRRTICDLGFSISGVFAAHERGNPKSAIRRFVILDFGFWIESIEARPHRRPQAVTRVSEQRTPRGLIQNRQSKIQNLVRVTRRRLPVVGVDHRQPAVSTCCWPVTLSAARLAEPRPATRFPGR